MKEKTLHRGVCDYIRLQYPGTMFNTDLSGAMTYTCPYLQNNYYLCKRYEKD